jgi:hypothetical protein
VSPGVRHLKTSDGPACGTRGNTNLASPYRNVTCKRCLAEIERRRVEASFDDADWLVDRADEYEDLGGNAETIFAAYAAGGRKRVEERLRKAKKRQAAGAEQQRRQEAYRKLMALAERIDQENVTPAEYFARKGTTAEDYLGMPISQYFEGLNLTPNQFFGRWS